MSKLSKSGKGLALFVVAAAFSLAGCASENYQEKYEEQQKLNLDLSNSNEELKQQRAEAAAKCEQLGQVLKQNDVETQKARQNAEALAKQNEELRSRLASKETAGSPAPTSATSGIDENSLRALVAELKKELGKQAPDVSITKDGNIEITLAADVTFPAGSAELSEVGKKSLKTLSPLLEGRFAPYQIRVEGHTDSTPLKHTADKYKDNFGLGSARSLAVVRFMQTDLAIKSTRLMSASRGEHDPVADEKSESGKKKNRRVEVIVVIPHDAAVSLAK